VSITWNTDVNAPGCPGEIVADDGQTILIQNDWDYPGTAVSFGWSLSEVQQPLACRALTAALADYSPDDELSTLDGVIDLIRQCWHDAADNPCLHDSSDGTVDCDECGITASEFINAAYDWLMDHDGATAEDPGYFEEV